MINHHFIFVGGLHRSGTTLLHRTIATHPLVSAFHDTGVPEDEGQFLQKVYPEDASLGGPGVFGLHPTAHMTEQSPAVAKGKAALFKSWMPYWDLTKPYLLEKTPGNLIRSRFLQEIFPDSTYVFIIRHPVACVLATFRFQKNATVSRMFDNWIRCNGLMLQDMAFLRKKLIVRYEDLCEQTENVIGAIGDVTGLGGRIAVSPVKREINSHYFAKWRWGDYGLSAGKGRWLAPLQRWRNLVCTPYLARKYEREVNRFGYSFDKLEGSINYNETSCHGQLHGEIVPHHPKLAWEPPLSKRSPQVGAAGLESAIGTQTDRRTGTIS